MAELQEFNKAAEDVKNLNTTPADNDLLELYSLFKQATVGDCNTDKPGFLDFKGKAKWEAWNGRKGMSNADAQGAYIAKVQGLIASVGLKS
ncbi:acyl-CoA-binding protein [Drosophila obscura]|uniref:acyl-CoA-binding protein n=1 Tax=Drosophila obscura TaxID=7282 RepID=UPI000BA07DC5|nr:acyl-CoA-binding protein [Drosophila obscura]